jgi:hypothetical protein
MKTKLLGSVCFIAGMALFGVSQASAASITYDLSPLTIGSFSLTGGSITTDGTIGTLASTDITVWSVTITGGSPSPDTVTGTTPYGAFTSATSGLTASSTTLKFDLSPTVDTTNFVLSTNDENGVGYDYMTIALCVSADCQYSTETSTAFVIASVAATPLPGALPLFAGGLGMMGLLGWRRKRKSAAAGDA